MPPKLNTWTGLLLPLIMSCTQQVNSSFDAPVQPPTRSEIAQANRPSVHYTPNRQWMNDPNGLILLNGTYHLFYQYNPFGDTWGNMSWGHATSRDLITWQEQPVAIERENGEAIFSGTVVSDAQNTSGLGQGGQAPLVAVYTGFRESDGRQAQNLAYSLDSGQTWTKYASNPVLDIGSKEFRDPQVFWHAPTERWVMALVLALEHKVQFYTSSNLKDWTLQSEFGPQGNTDGAWEMPLLLPLSMNGATRWVLKVDGGSGAPAGGSGAQYFIGDFDGARFTPMSTTPNAQNLFDFENQDYADWAVTGTAFGSSPARGTLPDQHTVTGYQGGGLVSSFHGGDAATGTLTSPTFAIDRSYLNFLIGGGNDLERTVVQLIVGGRVVRRASGARDERLEFKSWDVRAFAGKNAQLRVVDSSSSGWGHVSLDAVQLADRAMLPVVRGVDGGPDFYAALNFVGLDNARPPVWIGWMNNWTYAQTTPTSPWRGSMSLPRELELRTLGGQTTLVQTPAREVKAARSGEIAFAARSITATPTSLGTLPAGNAIDVELNFDRASAQEMRLELRNDANETISIGVDATTQEIFMDRNASGQIGFHPEFARRSRVALPQTPGRFTLRMIIDTHSIEVFAGGVTMTMLRYPTNANNALWLASQGGTVRLLSGKAWKLGP
jgi:sucrose-6-phosphate hydrolase SacC (GH32 family)